jgi:hypothetical protein
MVAPRFPEVFCAPPICTRLRARAIKALGRNLGCQFRRIQYTPDLPDGPAGEAVQVEPAR